MGWGGERREKRGLMMMHDEGAEARAASVTRQPLAARWRVVGHYKAVIAVWCGGAGVG